jgi:gamma-glutamyltranspeptidase / glutathione hydrolase
MPRAIISASLRSPRRCAGSRPRGPITCTAAPGRPAASRRSRPTLALPGAPCDGSVNLVEALNLATAAGLRERPHWSASGDSLKRIALSCGANGFYYETPENQQKLCPGVDMRRESRLTQAHADRLWAALDRQDGGEGIITLLPKGTHSDDVVAIDGDGNMVALCHSINCLIWGRTAIVVDGVSIGDPASYMQQQVAATPRGEQMPNPIELGLILKEGQPEIAWSSMGVGLHYQSTMSLLNVIDHGMTIEQAVDAPRLLLPLTSDGDAKRLTLRVVDGEFRDAVLDETGLEIRRLAPAETRFAQGLWVAIQRDVETGELVAISPSYTNGQAAAF